MMRPDIETIDAMRAKYLALNPSARRFYRVMIAVLIRPSIAADFVRDVCIGLRHGFRDAKANACATWRDYHTHRKDIADFGD